VFCGALATAEAVLALAEAIRALVDGDAVQAREIASAIIATAKPS